jgi:hypothetical protein
MSRKGLLITAILLDGVGILAVLMYMARRPDESPARPDAPTTAPAAAEMLRAATPATPPRPRELNLVDEYEILASPPSAALAPSENPEIDRVLNQYNARQLKLAMATLVGDCDWNSVGAPPKKGRPLRVEFDRATQQTHIQCGPDRCIVEGAKIFSQSAMRVDALYALLFRTFNPVDFQQAHERTLQRTDRHTGDPIQVSVLVVESPLQSLSFDKRTGDLLQAGFMMDQGIVLMDLDNYQSIGEGDKATTSLPMLIEIRVPPTLYPGQPQKDPMIRFNVDSKQAAVTIVRR